MAAATNNMSIAKQTDDMESGTEFSSALSVLNAKVSPFDRLPDEIVLVILGALGARSLLTCSSVSQRHRRLAMDHKLWRDLCEARCGPVMRKRFLDAGKTWVWLYRALACTHHMRGASVGWRAGWRRSFFGDVVNDTPHGYGIALMRNYSEPQWGVLKHVPAAPIEGDLFCPAAAVATTPPPHPCGYYEGDMCDNTAHGRGIIVAANGDVYEGDWINGEHSGFGQSIDPSGHRHTGYWRAGDKEGFGVAVWPDGCTTYVGEFSCHVMHGYGTMRCEDGPIYTGRWHNDRLDGFVMFTAADGASYWGECARGRYSGWGVRTTANGDVHVGTWRDDKRHGYGVSTLANGRRIEGEWRQGQPLDYAVVTEREGGTVYRGACHVDGTPYGFGTMTYGDGSTLVGMWWREPTTLAVDGGSLDGGIPQADETHMVSKATATDATPARCTMVDVVVRKHGPRCPSTDADTTNAPCHACAARWRHAAK
ncbi:Morn repeat protein [Pandoravirus kuranda]|uniref:Morn repeat protein n=1 Tax=Pandoravirus kuranda TaxID=3019033 RepID=A0AA95EE09_9VIRU|nr:Morn repeat protein [Pandoravirus kuranda]